MEGHISRGILTILPQWAA